MTDFILQEEKKGLQNTDRHLRFEKILKYAKFLKQPLTLGMFIPCDEDGNVLGEPQMRNERNSFDEEDMDYDAQELHDYIKAKRKILFIGVEKLQVPQGKEIYTLNNLPILLPDVNGKYHLAFGLNTIEDLCKYDVELTESVIKQFM